MAQSFACDRRVNVDSDLEQISDHKWFDILLLLVQTGELQGRGFKEDMKTYEVRLNT